MLASALAWKTQTETHWGDVVTRKAIAQGIIPLFMFRGHFDSTLVAQNRYCCCSSVDHSKCCSLVCIPQSMNVVGICKHLIILFCYRESFSRNGYWLDLFCHAKAKRRNLWPDRLGLVQPCSDSETVAVTTKPTLKPFFLNVLFGIVNACYKRFYKNVEYSLYWIVIILQHCCFHGHFCLAAHVFRTAKDKSFSVCASH